MAANTSVSEQAVSAVVSACDELIGHLEKINGDVDALSGAGGSSGAWGSSPDGKKIEQKLREYTTTGCNADGLKKSAEEQRKTIESYKSLLKGGADGFFAQDEESGKQIGGTVEDKAAEEARSLAKARPASSGDGRGAPTASAEGGGAQAEGSGSGGGMGSMAGQGMQGAQQALQALQGLQGLGGHGGDRDGGHGHGGEDGSRGHGDHKGRRAEDHPDDSGHSDGTRHEGGSDDGLGREEGLGRDGPEAKGGAASPVSLPDAPAGGRSDRLSHAVAHDLAAPQEARTPWQSAGGRGPGAAPAPTGPQGGGGSLLGQQFQAETQAPQGPQPPRRPSSDDQGGTQ